MRQKQTISSLIAATTLIASILLLSFYSPKKQSSTQLSEFNTLEIPNSTATSEDKVISFGKNLQKNISDFYLILSGTYGTIVLTPEQNDKELVFSIPAVFTKHAGSVSYQFIENKRLIKAGSFNLLPDTKKVGTIENYLGPRSIIANKRDYTMLVSIPTDTLDNLLPDNTAIELKSQFKDTITVNPQKLKNGFTWQRITAPLKTGRLSTASTIENHASKELVADIFPDVAEDFTLSIESNNDYADGNEIITFKTSQIKDINDNIMTDGTLVTFYIEDDNRGYWQTNSSTINGFAFAKMLHPQTPTNWRITAAIAGIAESPEITHSFKSIIDTIPIGTTQNRKIIIGPLTSYMGQLVQDGISVSLHINDITYDELTKNGQTQFTLKQEDLHKGEYNAIVKTLGIQTTIKLTLN